MSDRRQRAVAENEAMFREVNETLREAVRKQDGGNEIMFLCECGDLNCAESVTMSRVDYELVRAVATHFIVLPGHVSPDVEAVVERFDGYWIVEKTGVAAEVAEQLDPRS